MHEVIFMPENKKHNPNDKKQVQNEIERMAATLQNMSKSEIPTDVMGSYTGTARDGDIPIQDADDL
jgi:hypothetical protein